MPEAYSWETREQAAELYILVGLTYEEVAERTGVSVSQLKRWGTEASPTWVERRREYRQAKTSMLYDLGLAKARIIKSVLQSQDPQKAYAFASLVSSSAAIEKASRQEAQAEPAMGSIERPIKTPADAVAALQEAVEKKINAMLTQPGAVSLAGIKEMQQAMEMIEKLKARAGQSEGGARAGAEEVDTEALKARIERIYGA